MVKNMFESLTTLQKAQVYLLIPMLLWLLLLSLETSFSNPSLITTQKLDKLSSIDQSKIEKITPNKIVNFLEEKVELYKVELEKVHIKQQVISLELKGDFKKLIGFLQKLQLHLNVISFKLKKEKGYIYFYLQIESEYFFNKLFVDKEFYTQDKNIQKKSDPLKIDAIIENEVLLEGLWYKKGLDYKDYKLIKVEKNYIQLKHNTTDQILKVELVDESI